MNSKHQAAIHTLSDTPSLFATVLAEIRDQSIQQDRQRFRRNLERLGEMFAWEISKTLQYDDREVTTPLGSITCPELRQQPVLATILRAGLPLHQGLLNYFDGADNCFISAYRKHHENDDEFEVEVEYLSSPSVQDRTVVLCDPMLATGSSMVLAYQALLQRGTPAHTHIVAVIASQQGVEFTTRRLPGNITLWLGAVDRDLNARAYIIPGLGDAGDLAYGVKE